jgi:hypothetical protein|tara:strand:+ start:24226 stop:24612 length:387 start_codon:yes stop_codon:yes gene_type:complete
MPANKVSYPTQEGRYRAVHDITANASTDWTDISSDDFYSIVSGQAIAAGKVMVTINIAVEGTDPLFIKFRPRTAANDSTSYTEGVLKVHSGYLDNPVNLHGGTVKTISYKKTNANTSAQIICGFVDLP